MSLDVLREQVSIFRRNRKGGILHAVKEQYLRDDIACGVEGCSKCQGKNPGPRGFRLSKDRPIVILRYDLLLHQRDLLHYGRLENCVLLQSHLDRLERSPEGRSHLEDVLECCSRHQWYVLPDTMHADIAGAVDEESVAQWYSQEGHGLARASRGAEEEAKEWGGLQWVAWREGEEEEKRKRMAREEMDQGMQEGRLVECRVYDERDIGVEINTGKEFRLERPFRWLPGDVLVVERETCRVVDVRRGGKERRLVVGRVVDGKVMQSEDVWVRVRGAMEGKRVAAVVDCWPEGQEGPLGHVVRELQEGQEGEAVLAQHGVRTQPWEKEVLQELPEDGYSPQMEEGREDLRHLPVCSVDPPGCTDIDDALHAIRKPDGGVEIGVHIADVARYVREGGAMDREAMRRSTTVYLVDRRVDMLPARLSSDLCSLVSGRDRHAFSVVWQLDADCRITETRFCRSLIRSRASLTYAAAQARLDDPKKDVKDDVTLSLRELDRVAKVLRQRRMERGALVLNNPTVKFIHAENGGREVVDVEMYESLATNSLVEEFMLLANICVANRIWAHFPSHALLRRHPDPDPLRWSHLVEQLAHVGIHPASSSSHDVSSALVNAPDMCRVLVTRHMQQARYFCASSVPQEQFRHYGLACPIYTHFTSPIRRYADIVVHRLLAAAIGCGSLPRWDVRQVERVARHINHRHRMAQMAGRESAQQHSKKVLWRKGPREEEAYVMQVMEGGMLKCLVPQLGIEVKVEAEENRYNILDLIMVKVEAINEGDNVIATLLGSKKAKK